MYVVRPAPHLKGVLRNEEISTQVCLLLQKLKPTFQNHPVKGAIVSMALAPSFSASLLNNLHIRRNFVASHPAHVNFQAKSPLSSPKLNTNGSYGTHPVLSPDKLLDIAGSCKWRTRVSFFPGFLTKARDAERLKEELYAAIAPLDRGAEATPEDQQRVEQVRGCTF